MPTVLNTNFASLLASNNLLNAQSRLATSVERLSSGLRINRARDDAAGLGIANQLTAQINSANQGIRNLNDGISMVQTAEGAIAAANDMGQRILMLATQGANDTLGVNERNAIKSEMQQLIVSINSIGTRTKISGNLLLNEDAGVLDETKFTMQISSDSTDIVQLSKVAFKSVGAGSPEYQSLNWGDSGDSLDVSTWSDGTYNVYVDVGGKKVSKTLELNGGVPKLDGVTLPDPGPIYDLYIQTESGQGQAGDLSAAIDQLVSGTSTFAEVQDLASQYIQSLGEQRSLLGAYQNQMEYSVSNVTELSSNLQSARSRVIDTDYASETAALTKGQIMQQAATAMLAQANQMPNVILTLLK